MADLDTAFQHYQEALDRTPADHPERAGRLQYLGAGHHDRYQATGAMAEFDTAIQQFQEALDHSTSPAKDRLMTGKTLLAWRAGVTTIVMENGDDGGTRTSLGGDTCDGGSYAE